MFSPVYDLPWGGPDTSSPKHSLFRRTKPFSRTKPLESLVMGITDRHREIAL
jgi:hypothetical protein